MIFSFGYFSNTPERTSRIASSDRQIEFFRARIDRPKARVVEEDAVGEPVQHGALEAERGGAFEFVGGSLRHGGGKRRESGQARRIAGDDFMQPIVDPPRATAAAVSAASFCVDGAPCEST